MYYVLIEQQRWVEILEFSELKQADVAKLVLQTHFQFSGSSRRIYILDKPHYEAKNFGNKSRYNLSRFWYTSLRRDVKQSIMRSSIVR